MRLFLLLFLAAMFPHAAPAQTCGMQLGNPAIFCDTFDTKNAGTPSRTGDLDPNVWGVSRAIGGGVNFGQSQYNQWNATQIKKCDGTTPTVTAPNDVIICNGQLREASNDNNSLTQDGGDVTTLAMYPKQPFDFAGRTGTVSFDVSNDTHGIHAAWPEFWVSDLPVPTPFNHFDSWQSLPANGFGVRFAAQALPGQFGLCPNTNNINSNRWTVDSAVVVRNYIMEDVNYQGVDFGTPSNPPLKLNILDCVIASPDGSGTLNHVEIRVNQSLIEVWASDAGATVLRKIATITNPNLTFSRGLIWLEDVHYNADKGNPPSQRQHTFVWDNVAFDGPFTYRDFSYDALDNTAPGTNGSVNIGKLSLPNQTASWNVLGLPANPTPAAVRVLFNFHTSFDPIPNNLLVTVNGHAHPTPWPYPDRIQNTWRTFAVTIPVTDLVAGTNTVQLGSDTGAMVSSNINIALVNVPGGVPVLPGSNNAYPNGTAPLNGTCGPANGTTVPVAPATNLCSAGTASAVVGTGPWTWTCAGLNGGTTASCIANKSVAVNGVCGSANGVAVSVAPSINLCSAGSVSGPYSWSNPTPPTASLSPWSWVCTGAGGGTNAACSAAHF